MATRPIDWTDAITLEQYVVSLFQDEKTNTQEFKTLVRIYGQGKINQILQKHQLNEKSKLSRLTLSDILNGQP